jgi:hypothetical protein
MVPVAVPEPEISAPIEPETTPEPVAEVMPEWIPEPDRPAAQGYLLHRLANGPVAVASLFAGAERFGINIKALRKAKSALRVSTTQRADGWWWALPTKGRRLFVPLQSVT